MRDSLSFIIAYRYLAHTAYEKNISLMTRICFLGIFVGSCSLALVTAIMNGFEQATHATMQGVHADVIIKTPDRQPLNIDALAAVFKKEFPEIHAWSPHALATVVLQKEARDGMTHVVALQGIIPEHDMLVRNLGNKQVCTRTGNQTLAHALQNKYLLLGKQLLHDIEAQLGDTITLLHPQDQTIRRHSISFDATDAHVGGYFEVGIDEYDSSMVLCNLETFYALFPDEGITQIHIALQPNSDEQAIIQRLKNRLELSVYSWKDLYPGIVSALTLERYVMFLILSLITLVASMSIISLLFMQITQRRRDIAMLQAMGMRKKNIVRIFLFLGMSIATVATCAGVAVATAISWILKTYPLIPLPDAYYVSHVTADMTWATVIIVTLVILVLSFFAVWIPARKVRMINVSEVLRFEG